MDPLTWTKTPEGWTGGRYRIEMAAPRFWVLTRVSRRNGRLHRVVVLMSSESVRWLKAMAGRMERMHRRRRRLARNSIGAAITVGACALAAATIPALVAPSSVVAVAICLRTLVIWADLASDSAWSRVSENYQ